MNKAHIIIRLDNTYRVCLPNELKIGLKYIFISKNKYQRDKDTIEDIIKNNKNVSKELFIVEEVRMQLTNCENEEEYRKYKHVIKKFTANKEIYIKKTEITQ